MRIRTTLAASAVVGLALLIGAAGLLGILRRSLEDNIETAARLRADDVVRILESGVAPSELSVERDADGGADISLVQVVDASGAVRIASSNIAGEPPVARLAGGGSQRVRGLAISPEDPYLVVAESTVPIDGERLTVLVARALEPTDETIARILRVLLVGLPVLLALVALTTWTVVGRALRPVAAITSEVRSVTDAELDRRVPEPSDDDEIGHLARTMNAMLARLQGARDRQRQFVSDASHELRSPIATIRHQLEVALAHPEGTDLAVLAGDLLDEDLRMQRVVDDLLLLARSDERHGADRRQAVDLDDLALAEAHRLRTEGRVRVDAAAVHAARVVGDPTALSQVVRNLVDNAARHASGHVGIAVSVAGEQAVLLVDDDGPGIPAGDRDRVFERFTRLDDARSRRDGGAGLGLAIVAQVVEAHGGSVSCSEAPGGGARFEVRLPAVDVS
jgi:signal transduction histidine kinase